MTIFYVSSRSARSAEIVLGGETIAGVYLSNVKKNVSLPPLLVADETHDVCQTT